MVKFLIIIWYISIGFLSAASIPGQDYDMDYSVLVLLNKEVVRIHNLQVTKITLQVRLEGAGGGFKGYEGYIDWFAMGGSRIHKPRIIFADSHEGSSSDKITAGSIGGEILIQFQMLVFDYQNKRIGFKY